MAAAWRPPLALTAATSSERVVVTGRPGVFVCFLSCVCYGVRAWCRVGLRRALRRNFVFAGSVLVDASQRVPPLRVPKRASGEEEDHIALVAWSAHRAVWRTMYAVASLSILYPKAARTGLVVCSRRIDLTSMCFT